MLFHIIRKEILLNLVGFRFITSFALLLVLLAGSMQIMAINYERRVQEYSANLELHQNDLAQMSNRMQFEAFGVTGDPRPALLGIFDIGLEPQMSRSFMVPGYAMSHRDEFQNRNVRFSKSKLASVQPEGSKYANPLFSLFQPPDFIYLTNIVLSLLAILFAFDAISGEKENQTLKLMLTNSIPRDIVLLGKWIGGTISILLPFIVAFTFGALLVVVRPGISASAGAMLRILMLFGIATLYISVFYLVGLVFSTFAARSSTSLVLSLFAWVLFVLVTPNLAPVVSRQIKPLKPSDAILREEERMENDMWREVEKREGEDRNKFRQQNLKELPKKIEAMEDQWLRTLDQQVALAVNIARISPSAAYIFASSSIAGTGIPDYYKLRDEILRFREELSQRRNKFVLDDTSKPIPEMYIKIKMNKAPKFLDRRLELQESVSNMLIDLAVLSVYLIVLFMIAFLKFLRYNVN